MCLSIAVLNSEHAAANSSHTPWGTLLIQNHCPMQCSASQPARHSCGVVYVPYHSLR